MRGVGTKLLGCRSTEPIVPGGSTSDWDSSRSAAPTPTTRCELSRPPAAV